MIRGVRRAILVVVYAVLGAVAGRVAMDLRQRHLQGEPLEVKLDASALRPQEIVPGLIAAMRVRDRPWSYLHIPGWFAAFAINFAVSAVGRELQPLAEDSPEHSEPAPDPAPAPRTVVTPAEGAAPAAGSAGREDAAPEGFTPFGE